MTAVSKSSPDLFLQACGATGPLELALESSLRRWALPQPFALIGREPLADVVLDDPEVSTRHAYVQVIDGHVLILDLLSRTGTHWADGPRPRGRLDAGEALRIGRFSLRLLGESRAAAGSPEAPAQPKPLLAPVRFEFRKAGVGYPPWVMKRAIALVGRSEPCKLRLMDASVSRVHCNLVNTPRGVWVVDLLGRGGIAVNGVPVRYSLLEEADELSVGAFRIRCYYEKPERPRPEPATVPPLVPAEPAAIRRARPTFLARPLAGEEGGLATVPAESQVEAVLVPLLNQFMQMQQQMADQFHQTLLAAFQMFGEWHSEHVTLLRNELQQLSETTRELQELNALLAQSAPPSQAAVAPGGGDGRRTTGALEQGCGDGEPPDAPAARGTTLGAGRAGAAGEPPAVPGEDIHEWLQRRVAALEEQRQSRWQQILQFILGKKVDGIP